MASTITAASSALTVRPSKDNTNVAFPKKLRDIANFLQISRTNCSKAISRFNTSVKPWALLFITTESLAAIKSPPDRNTVNRLRYLSLSVHWHHFLQYSQVSFHQNSTT